MHTKGHVRSCHKIASVKVAQLYSWADKLDGEFTVAGALAGGMRTSGVEGGGCWRASLRAGEAVALEIVEAGARMLHGVVQLNVPVRVYRPHPLQPLGHVLSMHLACKTRREMAVAPTPGRSGEGTLCHGFHSGWRGLAPISAVPDHLTDHFQPSLGVILSYISLRERCVRTVTIHMCSTAARLTGTPTMPPPWYHSSSDATHMCINAVSRGDSCEECAAPEAHRGVRRALDRDRPNTHHKLPRQPLVYRCSYQMSHRCRGCAAAERQGEATWARGSILLTCAVDSPR